MCVISAVHVAVTHRLRSRLVRFSGQLDQGEIDSRTLRQINRTICAVGFAWAMSSWPLAESLDGLRLVMSVVAAGGLIVMANTTSYSPRIFQSAVMGFALAMAVAIPVISTIPWYVLGAATVALLVVATAVGVGAARQLLQLLRVQIERDAAIENHKRTIEALEEARRLAIQQAETDSLTGLANRFLFMRKLDGRIGEGQRFTMVLFDVDLFKNINDALGHDTGDEVLKVVGVALARAAGRLGFAARLGGDEFAVVTNGDDANGDEVFAAIVVELDRLQKANLELPAISITAGSAVFPDDTDDDLELLAAADIAQLEAKKTRRGGHLTYNMKLLNRFRRETQIALAVQKAVAAREHCIVLQPKIDLATGRVVGAEALSRFSSPDLAGYPIEEIFEAAENRGLGAILDELVLDNYREVLVELRDRHSLTLPTSVNLSGAVLRMPDRLLAKLNLLIAEGLPPCLVRLEITENAIYGRGQSAIFEWLRRIVELGFTLALDDFGSGSGSFQHLASLPISEIKIDRSFVSGMDAEVRNRAIVSGLVAIGSTMGLDIVAEGVETEIEAEQLRTMGANFAQGYLWSRPLPLQPFVDFVRLFGRRPAPRGDTAVESFVDLSPLRVD